MPRKRGSKKSHTFIRPRLDRDGIITRVRAELGEHFEDYVVIARSKNPDEFRYAFSNADWAEGAMNNLKGHL